MLTQRLSALARRLRWQAGLRGAGAGFQVGLGLALVALAAGKFLPLGPVLYIALILAGAGLLAGGLIFLLRPVSLRAAAIQADRAAGTHELISTAHETGESNPFAQENVRRAEAELVSRSTSSLLPPPRHGIPVLSLSLIAAAAILYLAPAIGWSGTRPEEAATLSPALLHALEKTAHDIKRLGEQAELHDLKQLGQEMQRLAAAAQLGEISKKEAMAKIAELSHRADELKKGLEEKKNALSTLQHSPARDLADAIGQNDAHGAKEQAKQMADRLASGQMSEKEKGDLAEALKKIAGESKGELGRAAGEAAEALEKGDSEGMGEKLSKMSGKMKGARGKKSTSAGDRQPGEAESKDDSDLDDAQDELSDAQDELSGGGDKTAKNDGKYCKNCGRKKNEEQKQGGG